MLWIVCVFGLYLLVLGAIAWISVHPPRIPIYLSPSAMDVPEESVEFISQGTSLKGWWIPADVPTAVVVYAHGYMMNLCELTPEAAHWQKRGVSGLVFDHRAHGRSGGRKCGFGFVEAEDIITAVEVARGKTPGVKVILHGSSMGSAAIAIAVARRPDIADAIILDSCYSKLAAATLGWWRFLGGNLLMVLLSSTTLIAIPMTGFNPLSVDIAESLKRIKDVPILFLHGDRDNLATPEDANRNFAACPGPKSIKWFEGCGHSEGRWLQSENYRKAVGDFLKSIGALG